MRYLFPETNYMVGRDDGSDFLFHSQKASRDLVEIITGPSNGDKTRLILRIMSRAKSIINGKTYKLKSKTDKPQEIDFTNEKQISIECSNNINDESQRVFPDTPIIIEWVEFNLFASSIDRSIEQLQDCNIDFRVAHDFDKVTHYYSNGTDEDTDNFKLAVIKGIPVLNSQWLELIMSKDKDVTVDDWLLHADYTKLVPNGDQNLLPTCRLNLLDGIKLLSTEEIKWIETIVLDSHKLEHELKQKVDADKEFVLVSDVTIDNFQTITKNQLWGYIKKNSLEGLPRNTIKQLKRPAPEPVIEEETIPRSVTVSPDKPKPRKRRKYEKVDRLHFFSLTNTEPTTVTVPSEQVPLAMNEKQVNATPDVVNTVDSDSTSNTKDFTTSDEGRSLPDSQEEVNIKEQIEESTATAERQLNEDTAPTLKVDSYQTDTQLEENGSIIGQKRKQEPIDSKPTKIPKFMPKVTLAEAVIQVKKSNEQEVIELDENIDNLKNLSIVEVVDLIPRKKKDKIEANESLYAGRKNFKRFRKPQKKINRRRVGLVTIDDRMNCEIDEDDDEEEEGFTNNMETRVSRSQHSEGLEASEAPRKRIGLFLNDDDDLDDEE